MSGQDAGLHCEDWFFCTREIPAEEIESAIRGERRALMQVLEVDPAGALRLVEVSGAVLLDVREDDEWAAGHAPVRSMCAWGSSIRRIMTPPFRLSLCAGPASDPAWPRAGWRRPV
jgi:hypothetical protein